MSVKFDFSGKTVIITGAGSGIGQGLCHYLASCGATVLGVSKTAANLEETVKLCSDTAGSFRPILGDLSTAEGAAAAAKACLDAVDGVAPDSLVNNAGVARCAPLLSTSATDLDFMYAVNVRGLLVFSQVIAKAMAQRVRGPSAPLFGKSDAVTTLAPSATKTPTYSPAIVNVSSQASSVGLGQHAGYCASKGAVDQLTRVMATELGGEGIRVNSVNPTVVLTAMGRANWSDPEVADPMLDMIPLSRFAEVEEVCRPIAFLLSDAATMVHGVMLPIDGGALCNRASQKALKKQLAKESSEGVSY